MHDSLRSRNLTAILGLGLALSIGVPAVADDSDPDEGYPEEERTVENPRDQEQELDASFPKPDSVTRGVIPPDWFNWKKTLYAKHGLKLGFGYQMLYQKASEAVTDTDTAWGQWLVINGKWEAVNRGEDRQGSLVFALDYRWTVGSHAQGFNFSNDTGSLWPTDFIHIDWGPWFQALYWEQWFKEDVFVLRVGTQIAWATLDYSRYGNGATSFTASPFNAPAASIPAPPPGLAAVFEWWPIEDSELYVLGTLNDLNGQSQTSPLDFSWDNAFKYGDFFGGLEVGYNWRREDDDFDHVHLNVFGAGVRSVPASIPIVPREDRESGWGFKLAGEKQLDRIVTFASYTYNTVLGGGIGNTITEHAVTAGAAFAKPWGIGGEVGLGAVWARPIPNDLRDQYGLNAYWKILLTPNLWITPGVQFIFDPTFNADTDRLVIGQFKFRWFI